MKYRLAATLVALLPAPAALAAPCDGVADLLAFIAAKTDYPVPSACPEIARLDLAQDSAALRSQAGAYFPQTGDIGIAADLDTEQTYGRSYLLHELVHAAQYRAGAQYRVRCPAELEAEAYAVQIAYLRANGEPREALLLGWLAEGLGRCGGASDPAAY